MGQWDTGTLGHWDTGTLRHWDTVTLGHWDTGTMEQWDTGTLYYVSHQGTFVQFGISWGYIFRNFPSLLGDQGVKMTGLKSICRQNYGKEVMKEIECF